MTPVVTDRERWLALGILLALLLVAYALLVHPWWTVPMRETSARIEQLQQRDARLRAELAQAPLVQRRLEEAQQRLATRPGFLPEATAELAVAGLVQRLETVVAQASPGNRSCQISNRSPLPAASGNEPYTRVAVQVRLRCGTPELAAVLHALESGAPRLFVENLNVLAQRFFFAGSDGDSGNGGLDVSFDLVGYLRPADVAAGPAMAAPPAPVPAAPTGPGTPSPAAPAATPGGAVPVPMSPGGNAAPMPSTGPTGSPVPSPTPMPGSAPSVPTTTPGGPDAP